MTAERQAHGRPLSVAARALVLATTVAGGLLTAGAEAEVRRATTASSHVTSVAAIHSRSVSEPVLRAYPV